MRIFLLTFLTVCVFRVSAAPETPFRHGRLDNGLTYYIRATGASAGKADFYLVQNVGALMEEEHQNGLAHVLEHMAFHATEHFPEGVPAFLKRRGIQDLNAYTGADETVYHIDGVPTTDSGLVDSCLLILHDWSGFLQLRADEMEIERKVILEERRHYFALPSFQRRDMRPRHTVFLDSLYPGYLTFVQRHADNSKTFVLEVIVEFHHVGIFHAARSAPGSPEIDNFQFPLHAVERHLFSFWSGQGKVGSGSGDTHFLQVSDTCLQ